MKQLYLNVINIYRTKIQRFESRILDKNLTHNEILEYMNLLSEYHCRMYWCSQKLAGL